MELRQITVTFEREGIGLSVRYAHGDAVATPGSKKRTTTAARMAAEGLRCALEGLDRGILRWGGFGTDEHISTDRLLVDRDKESAA